ncbi:M20/M25/M40 family metallo-hydrolase [Candidatus Stoquefichus massiliensis]|uniref:M20/M25/M40 family metallo-hydrolase n=1 Tax=Candidatus Stoquefichus massiliensis TaxID=1470350 RepID=UPI000484E34A|nr:M20/M25/M40 family metallo-hydrolase [Candidatus Stoquefichus massiliensis]
MQTNLERMKKDLEVLATYTSTPGFGVTRSSYSKEDKQAREYLIREMEKLNLKIYEDGIFTLFGRREGTITDAPVVMIGSHYDSVVNGGAFDGPVGCIAALEVLRVLEENHFINDYPIELILMNAEEGATFGQGSGVTNSRGMLGTLTMEELTMKKNRFGQTKLEAMKEYGLVPNLESAKRKPGSIKNFIEVHVEQGPILENENKDIGLVGFVPGIGRYKLCLFKEENNDTKTAIDYFNELFNEMLKSLEDKITGIIILLSTDDDNCIEYKVEIRTLNKEIIEEIDFKNKINDMVNIVIQKTGLHIELEEMARINYPNPTPPSIMNKENVEKMERICHELGYSYMILNDGSGHDAMMMTEFTDTNMLYVPSVGGLTHCPEEWTDYEDIKKGADVLLHLVMDIAVNKR